MPCNDLFRILDVLDQHFDFVLHYPILYQFILDELFELLVLVRYFFSIVAFIWFMPLVIASIFRVRSFERSVTDDHGRTVLRRDCDGHVLTMFCVWAGFNGGKFAGLRLAYLGWALVAWEIGARRCFVSCARNSFTFGHFMSLDI